MTCWYHPMGVPFPPLLWRFRLPIRPIRILQVLRQITAQYLQEQERSKSTKPSQRFFLFFNSHKSLYLLVLEINWTFHISCLGGPHKLLYLLHTPLKVFPDLSPISLECFWSSCSTSPDGRSGMSGMTAPSCCLLRSGQSPLFSIWLRVGS